MRFTIVTTIYNEYELLRQLIESIFHHVDPETYEKIVVFDDYSRTTGKLREYENYLKGNEPKVQVVNFDEHRYLRYYQTQYYKDKLTDAEGGFDYRNYDSDEPNFGHANGVWEALKHVNTEFVLVVDADIVFLEKSQEGLLTDLARLFDENPKVMSIGQCVGGRIKHDVYDKPFEVFISGKKFTGGGGYPGPMITAFRMSVWSEHEVRPIPNPNPHRKMAWPYNWFYPDLFDKGFQTMNFPLYGKGYVIHLGKGVCKRNLNIDKKKQHTMFGFCKGITGRYGPRTKENKLEDWYAGRHIINKNTEEFTVYLEKKFDKPYGERQEPFDESLLYVID